MPYRLKKLTSSQSFSPIRDVKDGIVITKDGRFVKIMEFSPINFSLRSAQEQDAIVRQFAMALRGMPHRVQFKIVTRKADIAKFVSGIEKEMDTEENKNCRRLQREHIDLITDVGLGQGVSRRFFLMFNYEKPAGIKRQPSFEQISSSLHSQAFSIKNALAACGNEEISQNYDDEYTLGVLYSIMSRAESENKSYSDREFEVLARYATSRHVDFSNPLYIPINDFIAPSLIDTNTSPNYIVIDGLYYSYWYLPSEAYPVYSAAGWMSLLINMGEGVDVDFYIQKEDVSSIQRKLLFKLRSNKTKMRTTEDTSQDYDDILAAVQSGYFLKQGIASNDEFCYMSTMLTITARSQEELNYKISLIKTHLIKNDLKIKPCLFQQVDAFKATLPLNKYNKDFFRKSKRNILTSSLGSGYPFVSFEMTDENGVLLGTNANNNSLVFLDQFDTSKYSNANMVFLGSSGSGKTYALLCMALRLRQKKIQTFIIAPSKAEEEFSRACDDVGGQFITIAPGSGHNINIMEIRKKDDSKSRLINGEKDVTDSILASKIQRLHSYFSLLVPDIKYEEKQILDEALVRTYNKFGITNKNKSLYDPINKNKYRKMPILGNLRSELEGVVGATRLYNILSRYVTGSASSFNAHTNVDLDNKFIVLDVSTLTKEMMPMGMFLALDYVWDKAREDRTEKKVVFIDETWKLIGPSSTVEAAEFVHEVFKLIRGYAGSAIAASQDLNDFFGLDEGRFGKAIINNSRTKLVLKTEKDEAVRLGDALGLTSTELDTITTMKKGTGLLVSNSNHVFVKIIASPTEHKLITTDRADLDKLSTEATVDRVG